MKRIPRNPEKFEVIDSVNAIGRKGRLQNRSDGGLWGIQ